jgi:hypothetical protein
MCQDVCGRLPTKHEALPFCSIACIAFFIPLHGSCDGEGDPNDHLNGDEKHGQMITTIDVQQHIFSSGPTVIDTTLV